MPASRRRARIGSVRGAPYACAVPAPVAETRTGLVRRARKIDRVLGETYPDAQVRARLRRPVPAAGRHGPVRPDHGQARQRGAPDALRGLSRRQGDGRRRPRDPRDDHRSARVLPGQDRVAAQAERRPGRGPRRPGAGPARRPRQAARRRPQDRQRRARQRLRRPRHHRRHPLRPAGPPVRLDRGDRSGQGRARHRRALPQEGLDDAQPPPHLARAPPSATRATPRAVRARSRGGARRTARARPTPRPPPCSSRPRAAHEAVRLRGCAGRGLLPWLLAGCSSDDVPAPGDAKVDVDTPQLRAVKKAAPASRTARPGPRTTAADSRTSRCRASAGARTSTSHAFAAR